MYTGIANASADIFDGETNQFLGEARFELSSEAESKLLDWVNDRKPFTSLMVFNLNFQPADRDYVFPTPYKTYKFKGIFRALFTESDTGMKVPVEMRGVYDVRIRSIGPGTQHYIVDFDNIKVESTNEAYF